MNRKRKVAIYVIGLIALVSALYFSVNINTMLYSDSEKLKGITAINVNDIVKNAEGYLVNKDTDKLSSLLDKYNYRLQLYEPDGTVIFDSKNMEITGKNTDINKVLSQTNSEKKIMLVKTKGESNQSFAIAVIDTSQGRLEIDELKDRAAFFIRVLIMIFAISIAAIFLFIYAYIVRPFKKLKDFVGQVAKGNLDIPLRFHRGNFFGAFTWSFDMLRNELKTAKERQEESERTKKELVAVLSHDIRTPIASIKAYAECLQGLPEKDTERAKRYIDVIIEKTDEITKLSQDMFMHAISDLERLEFQIDIYESRSLINDILEPLILQYENHIIVETAIPDTKIYTDKIRLLQVFENIILNTSKYSPESEIRIKAAIEPNMLVCSFKDFGGGISPEEIPFIFDKFFRGKRAKESGQPGTGLGLYIARYIMEKTGGSIRAFNFQENDKRGLLIEVGIKIYIC